MSKKVKGEKVDLASFMGSNDAMNLPSAPNPNRSTGPAPGRGGRGGGRRDFQSGSNDRFNRDESREGGWSRDSNRFGGESEGGSNEWGRSAPSAFGGSSGGSSPRFSDSARTPTSATEGDKWTKVFSGRQSTGDARQFREESRRFGGETSSPRFPGGSDSRSGYRGRDEEISDPRFASAFGRNKSAAQSASTAKESNAPPKADPTPAEAAAILAAELASLPPPQTKQSGGLSKEEKLAAKKEAERVAQLAAEAEAARLAEEAAAQLATKLALEESLDKQRKEKSAKIVEMLNSGQRGKKLTELVLNSKQKFTSYELTSEILKLQKWSDTAVSLKWCSDDAFGHLIKHFSAESEKAQIDVLYAIQTYCWDNNFPRIQVKDVSKKLIDVLFQQLYKSEIVDHYSFLAWADEVDDGTHPGKVAAVVQTSDFILLLRSVEAEEEGSDEEDDDEIDVQRVYVK